MSMVTMGTVVDLPMMLDQMVDSCHSLVLSGLREAPVTPEPHQATYDRSILCLVTSESVTDPSLLLLLGNAEKSKATVRCLDPENVEPQSSMGTVVSSAESDQCGLYDVPTLS